MEVLRKFMDLHFVAATQMARMYKMSLAHFWRFKVKEYLKLPGPVEIDETFIRK